MDTCMSIPFNSQTDEILEEIELDRLCREFEEADLFAHCFFEEYVDSQHEAVEHQRNQPQLQAEVSLKRKSESVNNPDFKRQNMDEAVSTSSDITGGSCTGPETTSGITTEGSHIAVASDPDNTHIEPHAETNSDNVFCSTCQKQIRRRYYINHLKRNVHKNNVLRMEGSLKAELPRTTNILIRFQHPQ